jgi:tetratricopeptide (TPR) repeat protein
LAVDRQGHIDPQAFVSAVKPMLERRDMPGLIALLKRRYTPGQIVNLLNSDQCDVRKVAALALSLVGCPECLPDLCGKLKDSDPMVNEMAERAIWSIWFRQGDPAANCELHRGVQAMEQSDYDRAIAHFTRAIELDPDFAEAWNQRATALYLKERYEESARDAKRAVQFNPHHFGAWAGLGHCYAHLGKLREAVAAYERALAINPNWESVAEAVEEIRTNLDA